MSISSVTGAPPQQPIAPIAPVQARPARDNDGDNDGGREVRASKPPGVGGNVDIDA